LIADLPDRDSARTFIQRLADDHPNAYARLLKDRGLLSDVLTLVSYSPLLAATLAQNPDHIAWLGRQRRESAVVSKDDLLESLGRFELTHSQLPPHVLLARFRRRELLRIYLRDTRRLANIAEITEEISNLADAVLEFALAHARRELDNRYGTPIEKDAKGRSLISGFCIVSLGKLGSKELNYASDIDLLFVYSAEGTTSGSGTRGAVTNREYFTKLAEFTSKIVGDPAGEGAAYRVDMRLRPHGRVGPLAMSLADTVRYYRTEAHDWERQVLIRSRASAGDASIYKRFFRQVENSVFVRGQSVEDALRNVRSSKEKIDLGQLHSKGYNVKLGRGGIREIEFIAQALQLAHGGDDKWLRSPHTLVSLSRLADRELLSESELTKLYDSYRFLRHLEHNLQMENGLQTHTVPDAAEKRARLALRMGLRGHAEFENALEVHTNDVHEIFERVFGTAASGYAGEHSSRGSVPPEILDSLNKSGVTHELRANEIEVLRELAEISPHFTAMLAANPQLLESLPDTGLSPGSEEFSTSLARAADPQLDFGAQLSLIRRTWSRHLLKVAVFDIEKKIAIAESKRLQTALAEASIAAALEITRQELERKYSHAVGTLPLAVIALGKLGVGGLDYESDLDVVFVYDEAADIAPAGITAAEFHSRAVEILINVLSSMTRDGSLYRVDLRLRPYGKNGPAGISAAAFFDYMQERSAVWELLAFAKARGVGGNAELASGYEERLRDLIHTRAGEIPADQLRDESREMRLRLQKARAGRPGSDPDIKYGEGGMLDVFFAMRFLQLRDNVRDVEGSRSTLATLQRLFENDSLAAGDHAALRDGYEFLSMLDHQLRLTIGRSTRLPLANKKVMDVIAGRMDIPSAEELLERLTLARLNIRAAFENIFKSL
jgi:glutamate-ammonia-ligase adenylyltransferase